MATTSWYSGLFKPSAFSPTDMCVCLGSGGWWSDRGIDFQLAHKKPQCHYPETPVMPIKCLLNLKEKNLCRVQLWYSHSSCKSRRMSTGVLGCAMALQFSHRGMPDCFVQMKQCVWRRIFCLHVCLGSTRTIHMFMIESDFRAWVRRVHYRWFYGATFWFVL